MPKKVRYRFCVQCGRLVVTRQPRGGVPRFCSDRCAHWFEVDHRRPQAKEPTGKCLTCGGPVFSRAVKFCRPTCRPMTGVHRFWNPDWQDRTLSKRWPEVLEIARRLCTAAEADGFLLPPRRR